MKQRLEQLTKEIERALQPSDKERREASRRAEKYEESRKHDQLVQQQYSDYLDTQSQLKKMSCAVENISGFFARHAAERKIQDTLREAQREYPLGYKKVLRGIAERKRDDRINQSLSNQAERERSKEESRRERILRRLGHYDHYEGDINSGS